jgi:uncharacterized protein with FMN-binding domain
MEPTQKSNNHTFQAALALLILVVVITGTAVAFRPKSTPSMPTAAVVSPSPSPTGSPTSTPTGSSTSTYKDGTYTTTGSYNSPAGTESIGVSVTLANNIVTAATVTSQAKDPTAKTYQSYFVSGYKSYVIGKSITSIKLSSVSGSSLTSQGFNAALKRIEKLAA